MFRKRSLFSCAGHSEATKEATVTPIRGRDAVCGAGPDVLGTDSDSVVGR